MGTFLGCSAEKKYEVLSFFFDGVPAPVGANRLLGEGAQVVSYIHKPYGDGKCGSCHGTDDVDMSITRATRIGEISSAVCLKCHAKVTQEFAVMHGPVSSGECLMCHAPHDSPVPHLLKTSAPRVCVQCHTPEVMTPRRPEHQDEKADCLACHLGHGGPSHGLIRPRATTQPKVAAAAGATTRPAVTAAPPAAPGTTTRPSNMTDAVAAGGEL